MIILVNWEVSVQKLSFKSGHIIQNVFFFYTYWRLQAVHYLDGSTIVVGSAFSVVQRSISHQHLSVMTPRCSDEQRWWVGALSGRQEWAAVSDSHTDLYPCGSFLEKSVLCLTQMIHIHSCLFFCSTPREPFIEMLYIFVATPQTCQVYYGVDKPNVPSGKINVQIVNLFNQVAPSSFIL